MLTNSAIPLPGFVRDYLSNLPFPVRVLDGGGGVPPNTLWSEPDGITIVSYGMDRLGNGWQNFRWHDVLPAEFMLDGQRFPLGREWLVPRSRDDQDITNPDSGAVFAKIGERTIWYAISLHDQLFPWKDVDLGVVLDEPIERAKASAERIAEQRRTQEVAALKRAEEAFVAAFAERFTERKRQLQLVIDTAHRDLSALENTIRTKREQARAANEELRTLNAAGVSEDEVKLRQTFQRLATHPRINNLHLGTAYESDAIQALVYKTDRIDLTDTRDGNSAYLGTFEIKIPFNLGYGIEFNNLDNERDGMQHPHVRHGDPCYGGSSSLVHELRENKEYVGLIEFLFQYLETFNPDDDYGDGAHAWLSGYIGPGMCSECERYHEECTCHNCSQCGYHEDECECCPDCHRAECICEDETDEDETTEDSNQCDCESCRRYREGN